eukprot:4230115-Pyramimonas_sp.AAC.1
MAQEFEADTIADPPGIAQTLPSAAPTAKACATAPPPRTQSASASSAQQPIAPSLGTTPAGHTADADALDEAIVREMVSSCGHNTQDKN